MCANDSLHFGAHFGAHCRLVVDFYPCRVVSHFMFKNLELHMWMVDK